MKKNNLPFTNINNAYQYRMIMFLLSEGSKTQERGGSLLTVDNNSAENSV